MSNSMQHFFMYQNCLSFNTIDRLVLAFIMKPAESEDYVKGKTFLV